MPMSDRKRELSRAVLPAVILVAFLLGLAILSLAFPKGGPLDTYKLVRNAALLTAWPLFVWWALVRVYGDFSNVPTNERRALYVAIVLVLMVVSFFVGAYVTLRMGKPVL